MKSQGKNLTKGPLFSGIITYTVPIILTGILQLLFNAADLVVVGNYCGSTSVAAVGATGSLTNLFVNIFLGLSIGAGVSVAHALGENDGEEVHRLVHTAVPLALVGGLIVTFLGIIFSEKALILMGTPENVLNLSAIYMRIYFGGMVFTMIYNYCAAILRAAGDTKSPLYFLMISGVINVVLNVIFVTAFRMDVAGVALATVISQAISAFLVTIALMRRTDACQLVLKKMRFYGYEFSKILRIGIPAGIQSSVFSVSNVIIQSSINSFGDIFMSGNAAAANIEGFAYTTLNAFHQTTVNYVGQNTGARNYKRVKDTVFTCTACVAVLGTLLGVLLVTFGRPLLALYIKDSAQAIDYGMIRFIYLGLPYMFCGLMEVSSGALRGMGNSFTSMVTAIVGVCGVRITWIYTIFIMYHTPEALYISYPFSWAATFIVQLFVFFKVFGKISADRESLLR